MKNQILMFTVSTILGAGLALAAPQAPDQPAVPENSQAAHGHRQMDPARQVKMLTKRLNLSSDQQNQILPILTDQQQQMKTIFNDSSLSAQDRRAKMQTVRQDSEAKIKATLNDSQKQTWDQIQQEQKERMQQWRKEHSGSSDGSGNQN
jgi:protein CpxP